MEGGEGPQVVRFSREVKIILLLLVAALFIWLALHAQKALGPFLWATVTAYILSPVVDWLEDRMRLRRIWIVVLLYVVGLAAAAWGATVLVPLLIRQVGDLVADLPRILTSLLDRLAFLDQYVLAEQIRAYGFTIDPQVLVNEATRGLQSLVGYLTSRAIPAVFNVLDAVGRAMLYLIITFYLIRGWPSLRRGVQRLIPAPYRPEFVGLLLSIDRVLGAYIRGQLLLIGIMSAATFVALTILHVRYALLIGLLTGVLEVIPLFGPIVSTAIAVAIALFQPNTPFGWSNLTLALAVVVVFVVLRQIEDQLVIPNLVGPIVDLHPLFVLLALFAGGGLAGFTGLVLAVPAAAALKIIVTYLYGKIWDEMPAEAAPLASQGQALAEPSSASGEIP